MNKFCALPPTPKTEQQHNRRRKLVHGRERLPVHVESIDEYLERGGVVTQCEPGISSHINDWESLPGRLDHSEEPYCKDVNVSAWTSGQPVATTIKEAYREAKEQEI